MIKEYPLLVLPLSDEDGGGYVGIFPDLPGCCSDGETREEAAANAEDALRGWLSVQEERGVEIPQPFDSNLEVSELIEQLQNTVSALLSYKNSADETIDQLQAELRHALQETQWHSKVSIAAYERAKTQKLIAH